MSNDVKVTSMVALKAGLCSRSTVEKWTGAVKAANSS